MYARHLPVQPRLPRRWQVRERPACSWRGSGYRVGG